VAGAPDDGNGEWWSSIEVGMREDEWLGAWW